MPSIRLLIISTLLLTILSVATSNPLEEKYQQEEYQTQANLFLRAHRKPRHSYTSKIVQISNEVPDYAMYVFDVQWGPNYCLSGGQVCKDRLREMAPLNSLTIHGLWPSNLDNPNIKTCNTGDKINIVSDASELFSQMNHYWLSLNKKNTNEDFWTHEYNKHGYCYSFKYGYADYSAYFAKVVELYFSNGMEGLFKNAFSEIGYGEEKGFGFGDLKARLVKELKGDFFQISCLGFEKKQYLSEIKFYFDLDFHRMEGFKQKSGRFCDESREVFVKFDEEN